MTFLSGQEMGRGLRTAGGTVLIIDHSALSEGMYRIPARAAIHTAAALLQAKARQHRQMADYYGEQLAADVKWAGSEDNKARMRVMQTEDLNRERNDAAAASAAARALMGVE